METLVNTNGAWWIEDMFRFAKSVAKLPYDHHELRAMVAPGALVILGIWDYEWLVDESGYVSPKVPHEVGRTLGIPDLFGSSIVGGHRDCQLPDSQRLEVEVFVDKYMLGGQEADTAVMTHSFDNANFEHWYDGWMNGQSIFLEPYKSNIEPAYYDVECATHGADWHIIRDAQVSNGAYVTIQSGMNIANAAPVASESTLQIPFTVAKDLKYYVFARVQCPTANDDSFWGEVDDGEVVAANGLRTNG